MKQTIQDILAHCPPYLVCLLGFIGAVSFGLIRLLGLLRAAGLQG
jgi:hypothetical protein